MRLRRVDSAPGHDARREAADRELMAERALRRGALAGAIAVVGAAAWGVYIFAGIAISGYTLGRNVTLDLLAVLPPLATGGLFVYGAVLATRGFRSDDWLVRAIAGALIAVEGGLGLALLSYAVWAATRVVAA
jgi:hypothetical protein